MAAGVILGSLGVETPGDEPRARVRLADRPRRIEMTEIERIGDQIRRAYGGRAWHGPSLQEVLAGVTAEQAAARPVANAHSIWEIVNHVSAWTSAVRQRMEGRSVEEPEEGDWPEVLDPSDAAWKGTLAALENNYGALRRAIAGLDDSRLEEPCGGQPASYYIHLTGSVQHYIYHAGQIALLKKALT
jgi:uncharacterized damage-inducible protein DinB